MDFVSPRFVFWIGEAFLLIFLLESLALFSGPVRRHLFDKLRYVFFALVKNYILDKYSRFAVKKLTQKCLIVYVFGVVYQAGANARNFRKRPAQVLCHHLGFYLVDVQCVAGKAEKLTCSPKHFARGAEELVFYLVFSPAGEISSDLFPSIAYPAMQS